MAKERILLGHGSGGRLMHDLIKGMLLKKLGNPLLEELADSAVLDYKEKLAFTTDSFVVSPLIFAGGDIGKLAVCGTVNDLVMQGALPQHLTLGLIIEEGLEIKTLEKIIDSVALSAKNTGVLVVAGDLKVVEKGACDKIFINSSGIGRILKNKVLSARNIRPGDKVLLTGEIAQHGLAVLSGRKGLDLGFKIRSDCASLSDLIIPVLKKTEAIRFMRDPTRGGVAATLNEIAEATGLGVAIDEKKVPLSSRARAACELLGMDPLYIANEGKAIMIIEKNSAEKVRNYLRKHPLGRRAEVIGEITSSPRRRVILNTGLGTQRIIEMPEAEPLPRIC